MPVFAYSIDADQDRPSHGDGFVRAETIQQAVALVGHPEVNVYRRGQYDTGDLPTAGAHCYAYRRLALPLRGAPPAR